MKRTRFARLLCILMIAALLCPAIAFAGVMYNLKVSNPTYFDGNSALKTLDTAFSWGGADATSRLVLSTKKLSPGQLTNLGSYGTKYDSFEEAVAADVADNLFGILNHSDEKLLELYSNNKLTFTFKETDILMDVNKDYYIYLWSYYSDHYYPDYLITTLRVEDGKLYYSNDNGKFEEIGVDANTPDNTASGTGSNVPQTGDEANVPKTGDEANVLLWTALASVSLLGAAMMIRKRKNA